MLRLTFIFLYILCILPINAQDLQSLSISVVGNNAGSDTIRIGKPPHPDFLFVVQLDTSHYLVKAEKVLQLDYSWIERIEVLKEPIPEISRFQNELSEGIVIIRYKTRKVNEVKEILDLD